MPKLATDLKAPNRTEDAEQFARRRPCRDDVSAPRVSRAESLSHNSRFSAKFSLARGGGRGRRGARSAARRGVWRVSAWAKALGREISSPASWRCVPRRVLASASARRPAGLSTSGGLGRNWAAQWHLARAVGWRFRGCRAKRLYLHDVRCRCDDVLGLPWCRSTRPCVEPRVQGEKL